MSAPATTSDQPPKTLLPPLTPSDPPLHGLLPPEFHPQIDHLVTEDDTPVDNIYSEKQQRLLTEPLYSSWPGPGEGRPFVALANVGVFYTNTMPALVPDACLSTDVRLPADVWLKQNRSYFIWEYGKPPDAVIEVVSNREGEEDTRKVKQYAAIGIPYYVIWVPDLHLRGDPLRVFVNTGGIYQLTMDLWFPRVNLGLKVWHGAYEKVEDDWLRWCDAAGKPILTGAELAQEAEQRAQQETQRAQLEAQRADVATQRAERLAAKLRSLGVDPNGEEQSKHLFQR